MAETKQKYPKHLSPRGVAIYPHLTKPDTRFKEDGVYSVKLRVAVEDFAEWKEQLDQWTNEAIDTAVDRSTGKPLAGPAKVKSKAKGASFPYSIPMDKDGNEIEGFVDVSFEISWGGIDKDGNEYSNKPKQFDAGAGRAPKPIDVFIRGGSEIKISYTVYPWATAALGYGIKLRPKAVQVLKLATGGGASADAYGFGEEDGYASDDFDSAPSKASSRTDADDDDMDEIPF